MTLSATDEVDRFCIQLYDYVTGAVDLSGKRILEVGCGRGGGCSFMARYKRPRQVTGLDLSENAIDFCRRMHRVERLDFQTGDAEQLPFADSGFEAVANVESSHCYPNIAAFFTEVHRVLKPGGHFLYADLRETSGLPAWRAALHGANFSILCEEDITRQV